MSKNQSDSSNEINSKKYQKVIEKQNRIHEFIRLARGYEKRGDHEKALEYYKKAYEIDQCAGLVAVCRGALADNYEALGAYEEALRYIEESLSKLTPASSIYAKKIATKQRLLKKIEESKSKAPVDQFKETVRQLSPEEQKRFVQTLPDQNVMGQFKKAMAAEQQNDFAGALAVYESLLGQREQIIKEINIHAWVMLYPGIQRTAELSKNEAKEKEALLWIKDNLFTPQGAYYSSLPYLEKRVIEHIQDRMKILGVHGIEGDRPR